MPQIPASLTELFAGPEPTLDVAALVLARDEYPRMDPEAYLASLDALAASLADRAHGLRTPAEQAATLGTYVYDHLGFHGNEDNYHDPRNSYLNEVLDRRTGIPISLAVLLVALGTRAGMTVEGIGFPGHFLVRLGGSQGVYLDPFFSARLLDTAALGALARRAGGPAAVVTPEHLRPVSAQAVVTRMLTNLKHAYENTGDHARALVVCDRLVDLTRLPEPRRDRGLHALALGALGAAAADLEAYLTARPAAQDRQQVMRALDKARRPRPTLQ